MPKATARTVFKKRDSRLISKLNKIELLELSKLVTEHLGLSEACILDSSYLVSMNVDMDGYQAHYAKEYKIPKELYLLNKFDSDRVTVSIVEPQRKEKESYIHIDYNIMDDKEMDFFVNCLTMIDHYLKRPVKPLTTMSVQECFESSHYPNIHLLNRAELKQLAKMVAEELGIGVDDLIDGDSIEVYKNHLPYGEAEVLVKKEGYVIPPKLFEFKEKHGIKIEKCPGGIKIIQSLGTNKSQFLVSCLLGLKPFLADSVKYS